MQGGMIRMALREVLKVDMSGFTLVFSEKKPPHCVRVKTLKPDDLDLGEELAELAIRSFARCVDTGVWPGPGGVQTDAEYVEMLPWARTKLQHRIMQMKQELAIND
jgi:hypothetical protein